MQEYQKGNIESIEDMDTNIRQANFVKHEDLPELKPITDQRKSEKWENIAKV